MAAGASAQGRARALPLTDVRVLEVSGCVVRLLENRECHFFRLMKKESEVKRLLPLIASELLRFYHEDSPYCYSPITFKEKFPVCSLAHLSIWTVTLWLAHFGRIVFAGPPWLVQVRRPTFAGPFRPSNFNQTGLAQGTKLDRVHGRHVNHEFQRMET